MRLLDKDTVLSSLTVGFTFGLGMFTGGALAGTMEASWRVGGAVMLACAIGFTSVSIVVYRRRRHETARTK